MLPRGKVDKVLCNVGARLFSVGSGPFASESSSGPLCLAMTGEQTSYAAEKTSGTGISCMCELDYAYRHNEHTQTTENGEFFVRREHTQRGLILQILKRI